MRKKVIITLVILIGIIGYVIIGILVPAGMFKTIRPHVEGTLTTLTLDVAGPEDITIDQSSGFAFISVDDRRSNRQKPGGIEGAILLMNLTDSVQNLKDITPVDVNDFHPHGISLWKEPDGRTFLFVVNHRRNYSEHVIERFEWKNDSLIHIESIQDVDLMTSPNDVTAVGERSFYVTNDHGYSKHGVGRTLEDYLQRAISYVNYYDGVSFKKVATGIAYANGINQSADHAKIYVASTTGRKVMIYTRDISSGALSLEEEIKVETGVDNIELDNQGALWIGCHPQLLKFAAHAKDPAKFSPSQVIKITQDTTGNYVVEEIFLNDGTTYSGSSVAAIYNNTLLIGSVFEKSIILCTTHK